MTVRDLIDLLNEIKNKNREIYFYETYYDGDAIDYNEYSIDAIVDINPDAPRFGIAIQKE